MLIKGITDEDFINYKVPAMFVCTNTCSFKCDEECGRKVCQNSELANAPSINIKDDKLLGRYLRNKITKAIVFGGLEPLDQASELMGFIKYARNMGCDDDIVVYTGYNKSEVWPMLQPFFSGHRVPTRNLIIKWGRFVPDMEPHFDEVLGINLSSDNQYAERISYGRE